MKVTWLRKKILYFLIVTILSLSSSLLAYTTNQLSSFGTVILPTGREREWEENSYLFYNPNGTEQSTRKCSSSVKITSDLLSADQKRLIQENQTFYEKSAKKYNFAWQIIAALHYRENDLKRSNPNNGQGIYQLYSYTNGGTINRFTPGAVTDEDFQKQNDLVADLIANSYGKGLDLSTDVGVKKLFFRYNGQSSRYSSQARDLGYGENEGYEGSPYVMNLADDQRNSKINPNWKQIVTDNGPLEKADQRLGAFVVYVSLGGSSGINNCKEYDQNGKVINANNKDIVATALNLAWPDYIEGRKTPTKAYRHALEVTGAASGFKDPAVIHGYSCDVFVVTVMRYSGADPNMPCCGTLGGSKLREYLQKSPRYIQVPANQQQPGDIRLDGGHIMIIVEVNGVKKIAAASYNDRTAQIENFYPKDQVEPIVYRLVR